MRHRGVRETRQPLPGEDRRLAECRFVVRGLFGPRFGGATDKGGPCVVVD